MGMSLSRPISKMKSKEEVHYVPLSKAMADIKK